MRRAALLVAALAIGPVAATLAAPVPLAAQEARRRAITNGVMCRAGPARDAEAVGRLGLGDVMTVLEGPTEADGVEWIHVRANTLRGTCWTAQSLTFERTGSAAALVIMADYALANAEGRSFEEWVRVINEIEGTGEAIAYRTEPDMVALLELRRLQLIGAAAEALDWFRGRSDPLVVSWVRSRDAELGYFEPGGMWTVNREAYEALHERFADTELADELLWQAASQPRYDDCEGDGDCYLGRPLESMARYWSRYPDGPHIAEAVAAGRRQIAVMERCFDGGLPTTPSAGRIAELRDSLSEVDPAVAEPILSFLDQIEANCVGR